MTEIAQSVTSSTDWNQLVRPGMFADQGREAAVTGYLQEISEAEAKFAGTVKGILGHPDLTPTGQRKQIADLAEKHLTPTVRTTEERLKAAQRAQESTRRTILEAEGRPAGDRAQAEVRAREIRDLLRKLEPGEVLQKFQRALAAGDRETVLAALEAPASFPVGNQAALKALYDEHLREKYPEAMERHDDFEAAGAVYDTLRGDFTRRLETAKADKAAAER